MFEQMVESNEPLMEIRERERDSKHNLNPFNRQTNRQEDRQVLLI